jgi:hypothetical protein
MNDSTSAQSTSSVMAWLATPFKVDQNAWHWVLFLGFAIVVCIFWGFVLRAITEAV